MFSVPPFYLPASLLVGTTILVIIMLPDEDSEKARVAMLSIFEALSSITSFKNIKGFSTFRGIKPILTLVI
jgi:hypothetical protein